jgi:hypothetical protein
MPRDLSCLSTSSILERNTSSASAAALYCGTYTSAGCGERGREGAGEREGVGEGRRSSVTPACALSLSGSAIVKILRSKERREDAGREEWEEKRKRGEST